MKISAVISRGNIKYGESFREKINIKVFFVAASALIFGTFIYILSENYLSTEIYDSFNSFCTEFAFKSKVEVFTGLFISNIPFLVFTVILGSSSAGYIVVPIIGFVKIAGIGVVNTYLYSSYGLRGLEYSLLIFSPGKFLMLFSIILLMQSCIENSLKIKSVLKGESKAENYGTYYIVRITVVVGIMLVSSLVDCILSVNFSNLFSF